MKKENLKDNVHCISSLAIIIIDFMSFLTIDCYFYCMYMIIAS